MRTTQIRNDFAVTVRENLDRVKDNLEKVAYSAVGAPVAGVRAMKEKTEAMTQTVKERRSDIQSDVEKEVQEWIAEGEAIIDRMVGWVRSTGAPTEVRAARHDAAEQVRSTVSGIASRVEDALDLIEPDIELTEIRGVGPANADTLRSVDAPGISSLLERTNTETAIKELADRTGIAEGTLSDWRAQIDLTAIDGIGDAYQRALHAIGIGTMTHLANADASTIVDRLSGMDRPGLPSQDPSKATVSKWIHSARRLSLKDRK